MAKIDKSIKRGKILFSLLILLGILFLGNRLREYSYAQVPLPGETTDEYSFGWLGISLIKERYPIAWSGIDAYENHDYQRINVDGLFDKDPHRPLFSIDKPWFDHPPLFGLLTGGYAYLKGVREFEDASVIILRRPMLKIALLTTFLIFVLGWRWFGISVGLLAAFLYSVIPTTVISSRLALAENAIIPLFLAALVFTDYYLEKKNLIFWYAASVLAAISVLFKLSGIAVFIFLILIAIKYGGKLKAKLAIIASTLFLSAILLFILYGVYFDWNTFVKVLAVNSQRFYGAGSEIFFQVVARSKITTERFLTDGWILFGWLSLFSLVHARFDKEKSTTIMAISVFSYLVTFLIFGSEAYGWYRFPFYPFLIISSAHLLKRLYDSPNLFLFTALLLLPFGTTVHRLIGVVGFQNYVGFFRAFSVILIVLFVASLLNYKKTLFLQRIFVIVITFFTIWISIREIYFFGVDNWYFVT